jgi:hypothetical protein
MPRPCCLGGWDSDTGIFSRQHDSGYPGLRGCWKAIDPGRASQAGSGLSRQSDGPGHKDSTFASQVNSIEASHDGRHVMIGQTDRLTCFSSDLTQQLWNVPTPELVTSIVDCRDERTVACLSLDGVGYDDG